MFSIQRVKTKLLLLLQCDLHLFPATADNILLPYIQHNKYGR
jgi:hypothetical protein